MESRSPNPAASGEPPDHAALDEGLSYRISASPLIQQRAPGDAPVAGDLPRSYGTETLCLMPYDPHSLFVYWDIDWKAAFREQPPRARKVHLRILDADGVEQTSVEVEPMAGNCYVGVSDADRAYRGEIGYFDPSDIWNCLATSEVVITPPDSLAGNSETDFATVPFHLTFQHMIDALRISKRENESLTALLRDLQQRAAAPETNGELTMEQRELARVIEAADFLAPRTDLRAGDPSVLWTRRKLGQILGFGVSSSPASGFGGSRSL